MKEKQLIEKTTAEAFLRLYNQENKENFTIVKLDDSPDVYCKNIKGNELLLEITLTEDYPGDIKALLGRSESRSLENLRKSITEKDKYNGGPFSNASCLQGNVFEIILGRIKNKLSKDYGSNVALVIQDTSPVCWNWEYVLDDLRRIIEEYKNPYEKGIWIINYKKDALLHVI